MQWLEGMIGLWENCCLILFFMYISRYGYKGLSGWEARKRSVMFGLAFGVIGLVTMQLPLVAAEGVIIDLRTVIAAMAGLFGGWIAAVITAIPMIVYRIIIGGTGVHAGIGEIVTAAVIGVCYVRFIGGLRFLGKLRHQVLLGLLLSAQSLAWASIMPWEIAAAIYQTYPIPITLLNTAATILICTLLMGEAKRMETEAEIRWLANYDLLTRLPNRRLLNVQLDEALIRAYQTQTRAAVLMLTLNNLCNLAEARGYAYGDAVIKAVSERLDAKLRGRGFAARFGTEQFVLVLEDRLNPGLCDRLQDDLHSIQSFMGESVYVEGQAVHLSAHIGIAIYPQDAHTGEDLLDQAGAAAHEAKSEGRNGMKLYTPAMREAAQRRTKLEEALRYALVRGQLELVYQPQYETSSKEMRGAEALLRWHHPEWGYISPVEFIPIAEDSGLILRIGAWVLDEACKQHKHWLRSQPDSVISVNISAVQLRDPGFCHMVVSTLERCGVPGSQLELEVTESALITSLHDTVSVLKTLRAYGIRISLDDFGTGYSSMSYLKHLPLDILKIDKSFIQAVNHSREEHAIVEAVITMVHKLGLKVVSEGIETEEQMKELRKLQCDYVQGYLFSRPVSAAEMTKLYCCVA
ncbi:putative bifunctional diguanylate cyclase/phosphodiesterase [Paenibacillus sp. GCM10023252]|uniref:putative bifunctional diguanylate cyclase/phosphodiesterase n=1 Tax=Paenibacillus sp. GCM10023252 TaxID=3252649 RepID=UPI00361FD8C5